MLLILKIQRCLWIIFYENEFYLLIARFLKIESSHLKSTYPPVSNEKLSYPQVISAKLAVL